MEATQEEKNYESKWNGWKSEGEIGRGAEGSVYKVKKEDQIAAMKHIHIAFPEQLHSSSDTDKKKYIDGAVLAIKTTYDIAREFDNQSHIVQHQWFSDVRDNGNADVFIRMEYLESAVAHIRNYGVTESELITMGMNICDALSACHDRGIIHRDIKLSNIFVDKEKYKLGDFNTAIKLSDSATENVYSLSTGAPEVVRMKKADERSDIYSLGMTMYLLLNGSRIPFLTAEDEANESQHDKAINQRINGTKLPRPLYGSNALSEVILKACEFDPEQRYQNAREMQIALANLVGEANDTVAFRDGVFKPTDQTSVEESILIPTATFQTEGFERTNQTVRESRKINENIPDKSQLNTKENIKKEKSLYLRCRNRIQWSIFTALLSALPIIAYLLSRVFIVKSEVRIPVYTHELVFLSIVVLATAVKDLACGKSKRVYPDRALRIGIASSIVLFVLVFMFTLVIVSEVSPASSAAEADLTNEQYTELDKVGKESDFEVQNNAEDEEIDMLNTTGLNYRVLFPTSIIFFICSIALGYDIERLEDLS